MSSLPTLPQYRVIHHHRRSDEDKRAALDGRFEVYGRDPLDLVVAPVDWKADPYDSPSWRSRFHDLRWLDTLVQVANEDRTGPAADMLAALVLDWARAHPAPEAPTENIAWIDKVVGDRVPMMGYVYRRSLAEDRLSEEEAEVLRASLVMQAEWLADDANYTGESNHGLFQDAGLILAAHYLDDHPQSGAWREHGIERLTASVRRHVSTSGVHLEHSPGYHVDLIKLLIKVRRVCEVDHPPLTRILERLLDSVAFFIFPDGRLAPLGDSNLDMALDGWMKEQVQPARGVKLYGDAGYAVIRLAASHLIVTGAYHSHVHKHADDLSFCLYEHGVLVVGDAGTCNYNPRAPERQYVLSEQSHNALAVEGIRLAHHRAAPYGGAPLIWRISHDGWYVVLGDNVALRHHGVEHRRWFLYRPGHVLVLVDLVAMPDEREITRWIHLGPDLRCAPDGRVTHGEDAFGVLADHSAATVASRVLRGETEPEVQGWIYPDYEDGVPVDTLELTTRGQGELLVASLGLRGGHRHAVSASLGPDGWLRATVDDVRLEVGPGASTLAVAR